MIDDLVYMIETLLPLSSLSAGPLDSLIRTQRT
jgi:hypothetical protein